MNIIETNSLTKYYGKVKGIEDVSIEVKEGDIFGFIGPNGAGKTTMIRTLLNLIFPTKGKAKIFGLDCVSKSKEIKKNVGYLPSDDNLYRKMNAYDMLKYFSKYYDMDASYFDKRVKELSSYLDADLKMKIGKLSRGNKRKISVIRSILHKPKLLILDEPTSGLDPLMQSHVLDLLKKEHDEGTTIFFSSHILSEVQKICNKVSIIKKGQIIKTDDIENLEKEHLKKVSIELKPTFKIEKLDIQGISEFEIANNTLKFMFDGEMEQLLSYLVNNNIHKHIENLLIEKSTLDEIFMDYYENKDKEAEINK